MKKAIVIIESENGGHKSSIIRTISQILIGLSYKTVLNMGELGLSNDIDTVVQLDNLKIGVASQNDSSHHTLQIVKRLADKGCDFILCAIQKNPLDIRELNQFAGEEGFTFMDVKSNWSEKLEVNYLAEDQVNQIVNEIKRVQQEIAASLQ